MIHTTFTWVELLRKPFQGLIIALYLYVKYILLFLEITREELEEFIDDSLVFNYF